MSDAQILQIYGLFLFSVAVGVLINPGFYERIMEEFKSSSFATFLAGAMVFVVGFLLVSFHNIWEGGWTVVITAIGWIALIKGIVILAYPGPLFKTAEALTKNRKFLSTFAVIAALIGILFMYVGFFTL